ncbi:MAG: PAS domain S-box protein, partial [Gammaproteobacteria bacterium]|nr:PAS domain S-box protein [Gammaproteobacteria bacterium]
MRMNLLQQKGSLKTKLSILVTIAVMLVITALGFYFDTFLKNSSLENATNRILHGYERLAYNLENIKSNLKEGISFVQSDEQMHASIELINNYQDKNNYNTYLIDEEKKAIAIQLLKRVKLSFNDDIALYDTNGELIAFVSRKPEGYQLGYISYANSQTSLHKKFEFEREYTSGNFLLSANIPLLHTKHSDPSKADKQHLTISRQLSDQIIIKSNQNIFNHQSKHEIGYIEMSRILDHKYFKQLSEALDLEIKYSFDSNKKQEIQLLKKNINPRQLNIIQSKQNYSAILKDNNLNGSVFYHANLDKTSINSLLNQSRIQFLMILILVTISILLLMRYIINQSLDLPLSVLKNQIYKIEHQDYSESTPVTTGDELEAVSVNINQLSLAIQERETSLKTSMEEQNLLSEKIRDSEAQLRTLIQTLPDLVWLKDINGVYLNCNPKFERLFGTKEVDIIGKTDYDFVDIELADFFRKHDIEAMAAGSPTMNEEEVTYADDGHKELLETVKTPMLAPDGTIIGVLGVGRDITERTQIEEELRRSQKMDAIGQLTGGIAHDFNNLLGIMLGNLELVALTIDTDNKAQEYIKSINKAGLRAANLTKQLLGFSRSEAALVTTTNINSSIESMMELIKRSLTPEVEVELQLSDELWLTEIDKGDLEDSLLNLSINARDAMSGRGHLIIKTHNIEIDAAYCEQNLTAKVGEYIKLTVEDSGKGISDKTIEHIFEP